MIIIRYNIKTRFEARALKGDTKTGLEILKKL